MDRNFFCETLPGVGTTVALPADEARHVTTVLRAGPGEELTLLDGCGGRARATIVTVGGRRGPVACRLEDMEQVPEPAVKPVLLVTPPRHKQMSQLLRQATELGLWELQPILTERSVSRPDASAVDGWVTDAREACKQSGNAFLPTIRPPLPLTEALVEAPPGFLGWVPDSVPPPVTPPPPAVDGRVARWIGPEGGFTDAEVGAILEHAFRPLVLGPWTLRVETAVVAGLARLYTECCP